MEAFSDKENPLHEEYWKEAVQVFRSGDRSGALFLFQRLAKDGCAPALVEVGNIFEQGGGGVKKDINKAVEWYNRSVSVLDDPKAHLGLGRLFLLYGKSDSDYLNAHYHFSLLENSKEMGAFYGLGLMNEIGIGVAKNTDLAIKYYQKAYQLGHVLALRNLGRTLMQRSRFKGAIIWLNSCCKICKVALKNPHDPRLGIA